MLKRTSSILIYKVLPLILASAGIACSPTRRLSEGEYLLDKSQIEIKAKEIDKGDLEAYRKQNPNKTILGIKFHLFVYNLANPNKEKGLSNWLRKIGEEPIVYNPVLTERTTEQFKRYLEVKGFYENVVYDSVKLDKNKATVSHYVELNEPHRLATIRYEFEDQGLTDFIYNDTTNSLIHKGDRFDKEILQRERERVEKVLKNQGFYRFSKEFIFYEAFERGNSKKVDLTIIFKENIAGRPDPITKVKRHERYKIHSTSIFPEYDQSGSAG